MRVLVSPQQLRGHAVGAYRLFWPADAVKALGVDVTIVDPTGTGEPADARNYDVLVIQRPRRQIDHQVMRALQSMGKAVVVDMDDDLHQLHPQNAATFPPTLQSPAYGRGWVAKCCRDADLVTVSTPALAERYGKHGRVRVLENCVPASYLDVQVKRRPQITIGWAGSLHTHPDDLDACGTAVRDVLRDNPGARFHVIGTGQGVRDALWLDQEPSHTGGWVPLPDYPHRVARLDVGIVPLARSAFNEAKSWLKGLEYAAVGVPFVATPTMPYVELARQGAGLLAETPADWYDLLTELVGSASRRREEQQAGYGAARHWTFEDRATDWVDAWQSALETRRAAHDHAHA